MPEILAARRQTQVEQETQGQPGLYEIQPGLYEILPYIKNQKAKNKQKKTLKHHQQPNESKTSNNEGQNSGAREYMWPNY